LKSEKIHIVPEQDIPPRIQEYAVGIFHTITTRSAVKKAIKRKLLLVNGKVATTGLFIKGGEEIKLLEKKAKHKTFHLPLKVLFEDQYLAIIYKPAGGVG
tara:strand:- start:22 stop:321 length:300 start_codon:yes stop_codon:yes gene_type:complete